MRFLYKEWKTLITKVNKRLKITEFDLVDKDDGERWSIVDSSYKGDTWLPYTKKNKIYNKSFLVQLNQVSPL